MTNEYTRVLEAAEQHLRALKAGGVRFLTVELETLRQLRAAPVRVARAAATVSEPTPAKAIVLPASEPATPIAPVRPKVQPQNKAAAFEELRARVNACVKCPNLASSRQTVVFGVGDINAMLMFVGEAPGADEDAQGEPFVGAAGQLLTRIIKTMGFEREAVYIANIVKCRPDTPGKTSGNRKPTSGEMSACLPYLLEQIELVQPRAIVALGATAIEGLLGKTEGIGRLRGRFQDFRGIPLMPTFHPAYLLRNQALTEKRKVWEDMLLVMEKMGLPISEKQRGYFLKA